MLDREEIERALSQLPLYQYAWIDTSELVFTGRVRMICKNE